MKLHQLFTVSLFPFSGNKLANLLLKPEYSGLTRSTLGLVLDVTRPLAAMILALLFKRILVFHAG